jgi:CRP/FNR family transcriptional regulator, cyclic AMP receptor protein
MEVADLLKGTELFRNLGDDEIELIARSTRLEDYRAGHVIIREGRVGAAFFVIVSGSVEVVRDIGSPNQTIVATLGPGEFFGEIATVKHFPRSASVRAVQDSECLVIWRTDFEAFISHFPEAAAKVEAAARDRLADGQALKD